MTESRYILAHDLGTTGNKATLFDIDGSIVAATLATYQTASPQPNWAEQDPADWQAAVDYPLTVHGTGGQTRAFIHIQDTVRCIQLALNANTLFFKLLQSR